MESLREVLASNVGKVFAALSMLAMTSFSGVLFIGVYDKDVIGAVPIAVLVAAPLIDLAILVSYWSGERMLRYMRATWLVLSSVLLASVLLLMRIGRSDADVLLTYAAAVLSFPVGLIGLPLGGQLVPTAGFAQTATLWVVSIGLGYIQWFLIIPAIVKSARAKPPI